MKLEKVKEKKLFKKKLKLKLDSGEDVEIDEDGHVQITVAPNNYYHTWVNPTEKTFKDHKNRLWKVVE